MHQETPLLPLIPGPASFFSCLNCFQKPGEEGMCPGLRISPLPVARMCTWTSVCPSVQHQLFKWGQKRHGPSWGSWSASTERGFTYEWTPLKDTMPSCIGATASWGGDMEKLRGRKGLVVPQCRRDALAPSWPSPAASAHLPPAGAGSQAAPAVLLQSGCRGEQGLSPIL